jgi:hypothetical protein
MGPKQPFGFSGKQLAVRRRARDFDGNRNRGRAVERMEFPSPNMACGTHAHLLVKHKPPAAKCQLN